MGRVAIKIDFFFLLIFSLIYIFIKYGPGKEPFERLKNWFNADKRTSKIIRAQRSVRQLKKAKTKGYIEIDAELWEKIEKLELDLKSELNKIKEGKKI